MLSEQEPEERLERPPEIDDGALLRIQQVRPVEKTASPIIDHNLELIATAKSLRPWYAGTVKRTPHELMSTLLDPNGNNACEMLTAFVETSDAFHARERERDLEIAFSKMPPDPASKEDVKRIVARAQGEIKSAVKRAAEGADGGCHHRKKDRDALVQKVIAYLAQSGVTFSIHNACKKVCTKSHKADFNWLYD